MLDRSKKLLKQKCFGLYLLKPRTYASFNTCKGSFLKLFKAPVAVLYDNKKCSYAPVISLKHEIYVSDKSIRNVYYCINDSCSLFGCN